VPTGRLHIPRGVTIAGNTVNYRFIRQPGETPVTPVVREVEARLLPEFLALGGPGTVEEIDDTWRAQAKAFCLRWGPLMLCEADRKPFTHHAALGAELGGSDETGLRFCRVGHPIGSPPSVGLIGEDLAPWLAYARTAVAVVRLAGRLREAETSGAPAWGSSARERGDWTRWWAAIAIDGDTRRLVDDWGVTPSAWDEKYLGLQWDRLIWVVERWLRWADVRPRVTWRGHYDQMDRRGARTLEIRVAGYFTFGAIAQQLAVAITGTRGRYVACRGSGEEPGCEGFFVADDPRRHYCDPCTEAGVRGRLAQRTYHRDKKARPRGDSSPSAPSSPADGPSAAAGAS
jgi:hypothetical protein